MTIKFPKRSGPSDAEVSAAKAVIARGLEAADERQAGARVQCASQGAERYSPVAKPCGKWFAVADAVYVDVQYWVPPHGCTGGAYWRSGEGHFVCPQCGFLNRTYGRDGIAKLRDHFARTVVAYTPESCFDNNYRFDGDYPFPPKVAARIEAEEAEREAARLTSRAAAIRARAA